MANTSKYIQLSNQILMEYIYSDSTIGSPNYIETDNTGSIGARVLLLDNEYTGQKYFFNEENPITKTENYRRRSVAEIDNNKYVYLTTSIPLNYIDYDEKLTDTTELNAQLEDTTSYPNYTDINDRYKTGGGILYDNIRLHLISGYDISQMYDGFIFDIKFRDKNGNENVLTSIVYLNSDNYDISNPKPFILGEKLYSNYIDLKIPSLNWIINDYESNKNDNTKLGYVMTGGSGFAQSSSPGPQIDGTIICGLKFISKTEILNGFTYFNTSNDVSVTLNKTDEYSSLVAYINESENGDYFEIYGKYNNIIYEDFISGQNAKPNTDITVIHDISVFEQIGTSFIKTSEQSYVQSGGFGEPNIFRPVIINSHVAVSYRIDYTMRIYNKVDNSQVIKKAQFSSFDTKKYGKHLTRINLGTVPTVPKIYNNILDNSGNAINYESKLNLTLAIPNMNNSVIKEAHYVMGFRERLNISASISNIRNSTGTINEGDILPTESGASQQPANTPTEINSINSNGTIYEMGEGIISISPFDNYILFVFYDNILNNESPNLLDLTSVGNIYLNFKSPNSDIKIKNTTNIQDSNISEGEVLFKINESTARKIIGLKDNSFYITSKLSKGNNESDETMLYHGNWYLPNQKSEVTYSNIITEKNNELEQLKTDTNEKVRELVRNIVEKNKSIREMEAKVKELQSQNNLLIQSADNKIIDILNSTIEKNENIEKSKKISNQYIKTDSNEKLSEKALDNIKGLSVNNYTIKPD